MLYLLTRYDMLHTAQNNSQKHDSQLKTGCASEVMQHLSKHCQRLGKLTAHFQDNCSHAVPMALPHQVRTFAAHSAALRA